MEFTNKSGRRHFAMAVILVFLIFFVLLLGSGKNLDFSPAYLLIIAYLLWMRGRRRNYYILGVIISSLMTLGFFLTTTPETRTLNLLYSNLMMVILVWVVIYFIYHQTKLLERVKKDSEQLSAMFENATEGILLVDNKGEILILNKFAERLFGYTRSELVSQPVEKLIPARFSSRHAEHRNTYIKDPHNRPMGSGMELFALHKEGWEFPVEVSLGHYTVEGRQIVIVFVNNITERKKVNQQLILEKELTQKLNEELEAKVLERTENLEEALSNLERSNIRLKEIDINLRKALKKERELGELKSRLVTLASHEFRTPLTTILSSVFLMENSKGDDLKPNSEIHLTRIRKSVKNLTTILDDFLSLSKLEEDLVKPSFSEADICRITEEIIEELSPLKKQDQTISYFHSGKTDPQVVDKQILRNILINLLSNAIKFSASDGLIEVKLQIENNQLKLTVIDQGIGIPEEEQHHLFSRFFRAKNAQNIDGTGLGLNIVKKYVDMMQGQIALKSRVNQGTEFEVTIPIPKRDLQHKEYSKVTK